ncbi:histone deacetylase family protein [Paracoccus sp. SCSIO 75233]|uniref:histone deacetylase family protein n=1 Tax=Paracoccus sp. SCSIO 75233 TaxID=3017782 RepID=UPI0022F118ED|nr:histone deacetylase family protein [Paracoccus sp. SCSIO 75233]WBU53253.1 histone deacetylase family protein [Paracoccus sp. SCSIO 75233]
MTLLFTHRSAEDHLNPPGHPEQLARYGAVMGAVEGLDVARREAPDIADAALLRCHPQSYLDRIAAAVPTGDWQMLDGDTYLSPGSLAAARHAAGGAVAAVDAVLDGDADSAFVAMRPPGHHAESQTPMGFCIFSNAAIAAKHALDGRGLDRVAVLDFDVHHGNGTQAILWDEPRALFASSHQMPLWPGTGAASERVAHDNVINAPLRPGSDGRVARQVWGGILERVADFSPQLVIISAGFDAHDDDPLAQLCWRENDFAVITQAIAETAQGCEAKLVSCLEGGYNLAALGASVRVHVETLMRHAI